MAQLEIDNLSVEFRTRHGVVRALEERQPVGRARRDRRRGR